MTIELSDLPTDEPPSIDYNIASKFEQIQFSIWCITVPFYTFILIFLIDAQWKRVDELSSAFFKLCISTAIIDIVTLITNYFGSVFPKNGYFIDFYLFLNTVYAHIYLYIAWSTGICQSMSVSILATNRLSALLFPYKHKSYWRRQRLWFAISLQFIPGCSLAMLTFLNPKQLYVNDRGGVIPKFSNKEMIKYYFMGGGFFLFANCVYLIIAYCYLFYQLRRQNRMRVLKYGRHHNHISKIKLETKKREMRLFTMCTITVAVQLSILLFFAVKTIGAFHLTLDEFYLFYNALCDLFASINPYLLWIFSDSLRKYIQQRIGISKKVQIMHNTDTFVSLRRIQTSTIS